MPKDNQLPPKTGRPWNACWLRAAHWLIYGCVGFVTALFLAWKTLATADFLYPLWYDVLHIDRHIATYAPKNFLRLRFQETTRGERERLFTEIADAIENGGRGLRDIVYHLPDGTAIGSLLRPAEVTHLEDVSALVRRCMPVGWSALAIWLAWSAILVWRAVAPPVLRHQLAGALVTLVAAGAAIAIIGPLKLFYHLHEMIFPAGHQWYFYYQESLMSTFMKAPDTFLAIAGVWLGLSVVLWFIWTARLPALVRHVQVGQRVQTV